MRVSAYLDVELSKVLRPALPSFVRSPPTSDAAHSLGFIVVWPLETIGSGPTCCGPRNMPAQACCCVW